MNTEEPEIHYPTSWSYTLIGAELSQLENAAKEIIGQRSFSFRPSKSSSGGKYFSAKLECTVESETERLGIYEGLKGHSKIKMVL